MLYASTAARPLTG